MHDCDKAFMYVCMYVLLHLTLYVIYALFLEICHGQFAIAEKSPLYVLLSAFLNDHSVYLCLA